MIKRLQISGIRSFSPNSEISIEFDEKLTIIIGKNGAGKSTILECIKFAATGVYPPNSENGRCFIHDPKLHNRSELTAYIRLSFISADQNEFKVSRSFFLSRKKEKLEIHKSENLLHYYDTNGNEVQKSMRVNEIDNLIPQLFSLNPAIIQYVCFCHQDDSFWPFGESSLLKKIFDQIFSTEEFSKAQDHIRKFIKNRGQKLLQKKEELVWVLKHVQEDKEIREKIKTCKSELKDLQDRQQELEIETKLAEEQNKSMKDAEEKAKIKEEKQKDLENCQKILKDLGDVCEQPEDDILNSIKNVQMAIDRLKCELNGKRGEVSLLSAELKLIQVEKVQIETQVQIYDEKAKKDEKKVGEFRGVLENNENFQEIQERLEGIKKVLKKKKDKNKDWDQKIQGSILQCNFDLEKAEHDLDEVKKSEGNLADLLVVERDIVFYKQNKASCTEMMEFLENTIIKLKENIAQEEKNSKISAEVHAHNQEQHKKSAKLQEISLFFKEISKTFPETQNLPLQSYEAYLKSHLSSSDSKKIHLSTQKSELEKEANELKTKEFCNSRQIKELISTLESTKQDLNTQANHFYLDASNIDQLTKNAEIILAGFDAQNEENESYLKAVRKILENSKKSKKCEICQNFVNENIIKRKLEKIGKKLAKVKNVNEESSVKKVKILALIETISEIKMVSKEIIDLKRRNKELDESLLRIVKDLEGINKELMEVVELSAKVFEWLQYFPKHFDAFTGNLGQSGEIKLSDLQVLQFNVNQTPFKLSGSELANLQGQLDDNNKELNKLVGLYQEYSNKILCLENTMNQTQSMRLELQQKSESLSSKQQEYRKNLNELHDSLHSKQEKYAKTINELKIEKHKLKDKFLIITKLKSAVSDCEASTETLKALQIKYVSILNTEKLLITKLRILEDSVKLTENNLEIEQATLDTLNKKELQCKNFQLSKKLQLNISSLTSDLASLHPVPNFSLQAKQQLEEKILNLKLERAKVDQSLKLKGEDLKSLLSKSPKCEESAICLYTEVEVLEKAINEQTVLLKALEASIINYHRQKIYEVNHIISKLWADTYKGSDIEKIYISADIEKNNKKSSFHYKISFFSKGQEIDMRGRCSSGQRMMASLVIRIALVQAFSSTFSVIALDEPTTNMDSVNAEGLAECIAQISAQFEKLQIIIITHDSDFMRKVIRESPRESYLMVEKLKNSSFITKIKVS